MTQRQKPEPGEAARRLAWGAAAAVGYILSPLSAWNDAFVNVPIALAVARLLEPLGVPRWLGFQLGYAASNIAGLLLLILGARGAAGARVERGELLRSLALGLAYSVAAWLLLSMLGVA